MYAYLFVCLYACLYVRLFASLSVLYTVHCERMSKVVHLGVCSWPTVYDPLYA